MSKILFSPLTDQLIQALRCLPGVGPKTAQRMAFHLLERARDSAKELSKTLELAMTQITHCEQCRTFCETPRCGICNDPRRDIQNLCIVESPADILAIEQTSHFRGLYFVLMGHLSPLDGIGPEELGIPQLLKLFENKPFQEVIIATNPTAEGEATAHYLMNALKPRKTKITRLAHGVPLGGSLEFLDSGTLLHALKGRVTLNS
ncbi:MAG: Recombination protein RecR [uncultured bacterium]|nr:MAG: Recombination protein RecR [uncultured bacterium]